MTVLQCGLAILDALFQAGPYCGNLVIRFGLDGDISPQLGLVCGLLASRDWLLWFVSVEIW